MKISYFKMFAIWFTVGVVLTYVFWAFAILPGVNIPAIPTVLVISAFVHLVMFFWIMWTYIMEPEDPQPGAHNLDTLSYEKEVGWWVDGIKQV
tara:strand:- start:1522 stop:1800 length:279 start_codon:yes stop_codon:yes gene_type:complete